MRVRAVFGRRWIVGLVVVLSSGFVGVAGAQAADTAQVDCTGGTPVGNYTITSTTNTNLVISGNCTYSGTLPADATLTFDPAQVQVTDGASGNDGTIVFANDNSAFATPIGGTFVNHGTIDDEASSNTQHFYAANFLNYGTIEATGSGSPNTNEMIFDNQAFSGDDPNTDTLENEPGGTIDSAPGNELQVTQGMNLKLDAGSTATSSNSGPIGSRNSGRILVQGVTLQLYGGNVTGVMALDVTTAAFDGSASSSTGTLDISDDSGLSGTVPPGWTLDMDSGGTLEMPAGAVNDGTINVEYDQSSTLGVPGGETFTNAGTLDLAALSSLTAYDGGTVALAPSSLLELGDNGPGTVAQLYGKGPVALGGTLSIVDGNGYSPAVGDTQSIVFGAPVSGRFGAIQGGSGSAPYSVSYGSGVAALVAGAPAAAPAPAPTTPAPAKSTVSVGRPKVSKGEVKLSLSCSAGSGCATQKVAATVIEKVKGRHGKSKSKKLVVASAKVTPAAGRSATATLKLNAVGRRLVTRDHRLKVTVTVSSAGKVTHTYKVTVTAPKKKKRH